MSRNRPVPTMEEMERVDAIDRARQWREECFLYGSIEAIKTEWELNEAPNYDELMVILLNLMDKLQRHGIT